MEIEESNSLPCSGSNGCSSDVRANGHVTEEQPAGDQSLIGLSRWTVHDVKIWRVESEGGRVIQLVIQ